MRWEIHLWIWGSRRWEIPPWMWASLFMDFQLFVSFPAYIRGDRRKQQRCRWHGEMEVSLRMAAPYLTWVPQIWHPSKAPWSGDLGFFSHESEEQYLRTLEGRFLILDSWMCAWEGERDITELGGASTSGDVDMIIWGIFTVFMVFVRQFMVINEKGLRLRLAFQFQVQEDGQNTISLLTNQPWQCLAWKKVWQVKFWKCWPLAWCLAHTDL